MTIDDIITAMRSAGSHWFDADSMRFFGTRVSQRVYTGPGGTYFVTTEKPPHGLRRATVRQFVPATATERPQIRTVAPFCALSLKQAHARAVVMASDKVAADIDAF